MSLLRITLTVFAAVIVTPLVLAVVTATAVVIATSTGVDAHVPGLVTALSGSGAELATLQFDGSGSLLWFAGVALVVVGLEEARRRLIQRRPRVR